ncbi:uncharacterized protein LOC124172512 [Ischnura elegans]|uniref:uncharacterized protein LOC124172512 n=1 Tax=Ischnura elegans TaxID=197161 RepID=UPI001ED87DE6|nr:uncharacterized protein LOC124172512 [Ischnura elegans]
MADQGERTDGGWHLCDDLREVKVESGFGGVGTDLGIITGGVAEMRFDEDRQVVERRGENSRERELLRRELELVQRERELLNRERAMISRRERSEASVMSCRDLAERLLPTFNPSEKNGMTAAQWVKRVEGIADAYSWSNAMLLTQAVGKLGGAAKFWFDSIVEDMRTWADFRDKLVCGFPSSVDQADVHLELMRRQKGRNETYEMYVYTMKTIAKKGEVDDSSLIKYILSGIGDKELSKVLALIEFTSIEHLLRSIKRYENLCERNRPSDGRNIDQPGRQQTPRGVTSETVSVTGGDGLVPGKGSYREMRCFNCNEGGHLARECVKRPKMVCYSCGKEGHMARQCPRATPRREEGRNIRRILQDHTNLKDEYYKRVKIDGKTVAGFVDLGSDCVTLTESAAESLGMTYLRNGVPKVLKGFGRGVCRPSGTKETLLEIDGIKIDVEILIVPDEAQEEDLIIGRSALDRDGITIVKTTGKLEITSDGSAGKGTERPDGNVRRIQEVDNRAPCEVICDECVGGEDLERLKGLVEDFKECFAESVFEVGKTQFITMSINLSKEETVDGKPYHLPYAKRAVVNEAVQELLSAGIIRESTSEYASPVLLVKKKTGEERLCVDYRRLNAITKKERAIVSPIEEQLDQLAGNEYFTTLDLACGYYQVPVAEESKHLTAFVTSDGLYAFNRMPFGLVNAPAVFSRMMKIVERKMKPLKILVYMDDILIPSATIEEGFEKLERFLQIMREEGLTLRLKKCKFFQKRVDFLGYEITSKGIRPGKTKIAAVEDFKTPTTVHEVRRFCGLASYFRKFIEGYAAIAKPLTKLLRKDEKFVWGEDQQRAFEEIKRKLITRPILVLYDPEKNHKLDTDASKCGVAGILLQEEGTEWKPVAYYSRQTSEAESRYHSYELEALAVVESVERFRIYLLGKHFQVFTDCNVLKATMTKKDLVPRVGRWWLKLQEFDFELQYKPGVQMQHVDALSRQPEGEPKETEVATLSVWTTRISQEDWLLTMQMQDAELRNIRELLQRAPKTPEEKQIHTDYEMKMKGSVDG